MASLHPLQPLQSSILELLAEVSPISVDTLRIELIKRASLTPSVATVYRILKELEDAQVIVRSHGCIQLNAVWVSYIARFAEKARSFQTTDRESMQKLSGLRTGERIQFFAESLMELDPIWNHTLIELVRIETIKDWYMYNSHPWYSLGMQATETRLYQGLWNEGITSCMLYGNNSFLDRYGKEMISVTGMQSVCACDTPLPKEGYALWLCGNTIVDCMFPEAINTFFSHFFRSVESIDQFNPSIFSDIFRMKARCTLTVRRDPKEAEKLRKIIASYF